MSLCSCEKSTTIRALNNHDTMVWLKRFYCALVSNGYGCGCEQDQHIFYNFKFPHRLMNKGNIL